LSRVLRPLQHSIGYMGDGFYRSKDPTNSIKVLKEKAAKENNAIIRRWRRLSAELHSLSCAGDDCQCSVSPA